MWREALGTALVSWMFSHCSKQPGRLTCVMPLNPGKPRPMPGEGNGATHTGEWGCASPGGLHAAGSGMNGERGSPEAFMPISAQLHPTRPSPTLGRGLGPLLSPLPSPIFVWAQVCKVAALQPALHSALVSPLRKPPREGRMAGSGSCLEPQVRHTLDMPSGSATTACQLCSASLLSPAGASDKARAGTQAAMANYPDAIHSAPLRADPGLEH